MGDPGGGRQPAPEQYPVAASGPGAASRAAKAFAGVDGPVTVRALGAGNINDTYLVSCPGAPKRLLQRVNRRVFPDPAVVVENVRVVTEYLASAAGGESFGPQLRLLPSRAGGFCWRDPDGEVWRLITYIDRAEPPGKPPTPVAAFEGGRLLADFHRRLTGLDPKRLQPTLPGFHDLPGYCRRYCRLRDRHQRRLDPELRHCLRQADQRLPDRFLLTEAARRGVVARRVIHGDPKADNMLFDRDSGQGLVLVDLDTVMAGLLQQDLGDCLRSFCNPGGENSGDRTEFDPELCRQVLKGYGLTTPPLPPAERQLIYPGLRLLTYELGVRFLSDYLDGDRYFKISGPNDNLRRALIQFQLLDSIERQQRELEALIEQNLPVS